MMTPIPGTTTDIEAPQDHPDHSIVHDGTTPNFMLNKANGKTDIGSSTIPLQCNSMSDGESYECYGEAGIDNMDTDASTNGQGDGIGNNGNQLINRHTWLRTSLRKSPNHSTKDVLPNRRWGSFRTSTKRTIGGSTALTTSSSFNSSGRSSTCDTADDMYSDISIEDDVHDLNHKVQLIQQQVDVLTDSANNSDDRYVRTKAENAALQARVLMLEEQLRDVELRAEERFQDEQRRQREIMVRVEREKQLQIENCSIRLQSMELQAVSVREEVARQRTIIERLRHERNEAIERAKEAEVLYNDVRVELELLRDAERRQLIERENDKQLLDELSREVERLRAEACTPALPTTDTHLLRLEELHNEMESLRDQNKSLRACNEELEATLIARSVEEGRSLLLVGTNGSNDPNLQTPSLAAEFQAMSQDQMQRTLKEQQDVNAQLRSYIDGILLNIVENYPQLLEVKHHRPPPHQTKS